MQYIKDADTGEVFINTNEGKVEIPPFVKDDFPEITTNYSGENDVNDIILDLSKQLKDERNAKTVHHDFPMFKMICSTALVTIIVVAGVFGVGFARSIKFEPVVIEYTSSTTSDSIQSEENCESAEKTDEGVLTDTVDATSGNSAEGHDLGLTTEQVVAIVLLCVFSLLMLLLPIFFV